jgi:hypothetical protein
MSKFVMLRMLGLKASVNSFVVMDSDDAFFVWKSSWYPSPIGWSLLTNWLRGSSKSKLARWDSNIIHQHRSPLILSHLAGLCAKLHWSHKSVSPTMQHILVRDGHSCSARQDST